MEPTGKLIVITGPSGVGKGTLLRKLLSRHPDLYLSVSATTRAPRPGEVDGQHYYFVSRKHFEAKIEAGELLEWAEFAGNYYGTPCQPIEQGIQAGKQIILEIELAGARQVKTHFPEALRIFILPPSLEALEERLRQRGKDADEAIARRLQIAQSELEAACEFNCQIVNNQVTDAVDALEQAIFAPTELLS